MIARFGRIDSPAIHLGAACPQMLSVCLTPDDCGAGIGGQVQEVLDRIGAMLLDRGAGRDRLMMVQVWLADIGDLQVFSTVWNGWIDPDHPPALSVIQGAASRRDTLVEIRAWAAPGGMERCNRG
jgi:enamine deaminase RidA (YjgF/YER057c/UK114 family)